MADESNELREKLAEHLNVFSVALMLHLMNDRMKRVTADAAAEAYRGRLYLPEDVEAEFMWRVRTPLSVLPPVLQKACLQEADQVLAILDEFGDRWRSRNEGDDA